MIFAIPLAALLLAWLVYVLFENGPTAGGIAVTALVIWALIDYGS